MRFLPLYESPLFNPDPKFKIKHSKFKIISALDFRSHPLKPDTSPPPDT